MTITILWWHYSAVFLALPIAIGMVTENADAFLAFCALCFGISIGIVIGHYV